MHGLFYLTAAAHTSGSYSYSVSAEVGLLTRNVKIIGGDYDDLQTQSFGGRILVGDYYDGHQQWTGMKSGKSYYYSSYKNCRKLNKLYKLYYYLTILLFQLL